MKKLSYAIILASSLIFIMPFLFYFTTTDTNKEKIKTNLSDDTPSVYETESENISQALGQKSKEYVSNSAISGYMIQSENDNVYVYEIYENGYREKIKALDINPKFLRKTDRENLQSGILKSSYTEICSLIEDYSS